MNALLLEWSRRIGCVSQKGGMTMKNPLDSIWGTIICGLILTAILYLAAKNLLM